MIKEDFIVILPIASYEQHGKLLPLDTDFTLGKNIGEMLSKKIDIKCHLLPTLPFGYAEEHKDFYGSISVDPINYFNFLKNLISSIYTAFEPKLVVVLNSHGGNLNIAKAVTTHLNYNNISKSMVYHLFSTNVEQYCESLIGYTDTHAGTTEASLYNFFEGIPAETNIQNAKFTKKFSSSLNLFRTIQVAEEGVISDMPEIIVKKEWGEKIANYMVDDLILRIKADIEKINIIK